MSASAPCGPSNSAPCSGNGECVGRFGCRCRDGFGGSLCDVRLPPATTEGLVLGSGGGGEVAILPTAVTAGIVLLICIACVVACCCSVRRGRRRKDPAYFDDVGRPLPARRVIKAQVARTLRSTADFSKSDIKPDARRRADHERERRERDAKKSHADREAERAAKLAMGFDVDGVELQPRPSTNPELDRSDSSGSGGEAVFKPLAKVERESSTLGSDVVAPAAKRAVRANSEYEKVPPQIVASPREPAAPSPGTAAAVAAAAAAPRRATAGMSSAHNTPEPPRRQTAAMKTAADHTPESQRRQTSALSTAAATPESQRRQPAAVSTAASARAALPSVKSSYVPPATVDLPTVDLDSIKVKQIDAVVAARASEAEQPPAPPTPPPEFLSSEDESSDVPPIPAGLPEPPPFDDTLVPEGDDDDDDDLPAFIDDEAPPPFQPLDADQLV